MPRGRWGVVAALTGLTAVFLALGVGAYFGALNAPHYGYQAAHSSERTPGAEQHYPSQIDRDRAGLPYFAERIASGADPEDGSEREKRDLAAQESMAVWAFWLLLVSVFGTVATMIGTGFLIWQIMLTRDAVRDTGRATKAMRKGNKIARKSAMRQLRAYLDIEWGRIEQFGPQRAKAAIRLKNFGQTPAYNIRIWINISSVISREERTGRRTVYALPLPPGHGRTAATTVKIGECFHGKIVDGEASLCLTVFLEYWTLGKMDTQLYKLKWPYNPTGLGELVEVEDT